MTNPTLLCDGFQRCIIVKGKRASVSLHERNSQANVHVCLHQLLENKIPDVQGVDNKIRLVYFVGNTKNDK